MFVDDDPPVVKYMLRLSSFFAPVQRALGVNVELLEVLLRTKLVLENRMKGGQAALGFVKNAGMGLMVLMYLALGFVFGAMSFLDVDERIFINIIGTVSFAMLLMPLMVDFASILLDTEDVKIFSPLPVDDRTVLALRVTHIGVYMLALMASFALGPMVLGSLNYNPLVIVPSVLLSTIQSAALGLASVLVLYLIALKTLDLSRFRDAMVYIQVIGFVGFYLATQLGPQLVGRSEFLKSLLGRDELLVLWPPAAGGALARLVGGTGEPYDFVVATTGWVVTLGLVIWATWLGRSGFVARLAELESAGGKVGERVRRHGLTGRLVNKIPKGPLERAGWTFFLALSSSERSFKLRTMPMIVVSVMPFVMMFVLRRDAEMQAILSGLAYAPYVLLFILPGIWDASRFSESWEASRMFEAMSEAEMQRFSIGARRAALVRYLGIPLLIVTPALILLCGVESLFGIVLAAEVAFAAAIWIIGWFTHAPFSEKFSQSNARTNFALMFATVPVVFGLGAAQYGLSHVPFGVPIVALICAPLVWKLWCQLPTKRKRKSRRRRR